MYYFCTYFDWNYLPRGLALYRSLREHCPEYKLWVLCMDDETHEALIQLDLPEVELIALQEFEKGDDSLLSAKQNRSRVEYYFTCTPSLPLYVFNHWSEVDFITYLDADLYFFADPQPVYEEIAGSSIAIISHRYPPNFHYRQVYGIYNVGWLSFRRDIHGLKCLHWWRARCIEWCYDRAEDGLFADQKFLDDWPTRFEGVVVLGHKGANVAPWNLANYAIRSDGNRVWVDEQPLIFYHFHGLKQITSWLYNPHLRGNAVRMSTAVRKGIYAPYIETLWNTRMAGQYRTCLSPQLPHINSPDIRTSLAAQASLLSRLSKYRRAVFGVCEGIATSEYILVVKGRVL